MSDPGLVDRYLDEMAKCTTVNQFNRVHIHIQIHYSPQEVCRIIEDPAQFEHVGHLPGLLFSTTRDVFRYRGKN